MTHRRSEVHYVKPPAVAEEFVRYRERCAGCNYLMVTDNQTWKLMQSDAGRVACAPLCDVCEPMVHGDDPDPEAVAYVAREIAQRQAVSE